MFRDLLFFRYITFKHKLVQPYCFKFYLQINTTTPLKKPLLRHTGVGRGAGRGGGARQLPAAVVRPRLHEALPGRGRLLDDADGSQV